MIHLTVSVFVWLMEWHSFVGVNCLQHALCANTSVTQHKYVPIASAVTSMSRTVTAAFTLECLSLRFKVFCCYSFLSDRRHLLPSTALLRTGRATFTAYGSSLH